MPDISDSTATRRAVLGGAVGLGGAAALAGTAAPAGARISSGAMAGLVSSFSRYYLTIPGVAGETTDENFPGAIRVGSWEFGVDLPVSGAASSGGQAAGKSKPGPLRVDAASGKQSPRLFLGCAKGTSYATATLDGMGELYDGGEEVRFLTLKMEKVFISTYDVVGSEAPFDRFSLNFSKLTYTFKYLNGETVSSVTTGWDWAGNKQA